MKKFFSKMSKRTKTWLIVVAVIIVAVLVLVVLGARNRATSASAYQTVPVELGNLTATIGATGSVHSNQSAILTWQATGTIDVVKVKPGDKVQAGSVLASLVLPSLTQSTLESNLVTAQENLAELTSPEAIANAKLAITQAKTDVINAQYNFNNQQYWKNDALIQDQYANLVIAKDNLDRAQTAYDSANVGEYINNVGEAALYQALYNARQAYDRAEYFYSLYSQKPSQRQVDEAQATLDLANATLINAQNYLAAITGEEVPADATGTMLAKFKQAQLAVQTAQANLDTSITAPFTGTVTEVSGMKGDQVSPGTKAFRIDDLSHMKIDVQVSEVDINSVQVGQPVTVTFDAISGKTYNGKVVEVALAGDSVQGAVNFTVTVELTDADEAVKPGMTAAVIIVVNQVNDVLLIPNRAVRLVNDQRVVYVLRDGVAQQVEVTLGASSDTMSEVVPGDIKANDLVILNPPSNLFSSPSGGGGAVFGGGN